MVRDVAQALSSCPPPQDAAYGIVLIEESERRDTGSDNAPRRPMRQNRTVSAGPVFWGSFTGETLEKAMAVLLAQDYSELLRRTPSSGDGGVDVLIQKDEGWHVHQIKGFVGRMDSNRRRKVEKSFETVCAEPRLNQPVVNWSLTVPIDPTSGEQEWFEALTSTAPFPCTWKGQVFWDSMASQHPHVIDYYFRDGRQRLEVHSEALLGAARAAVSPLTPSEVAGHLEQLRAGLNRDDPHYRYEFSTGDRPSGPLPPGSVMAASSRMEDGRYLTIYVRPKHRYAQDDSPIRGNLNLRLFDEERGFDLREEFERFRIFGTGIDLPSGTVSGVIEAPGGFGGEFSGSAGRIGPRLIRDPPAHMRLRLVHPEQGVTVELGIKTVTATRGELNGIRVEATDDAEVLHVLFELLPQDAESSGRMSFHTELNLDDGTPIQALIPAIRLVSGFCPPHELQWLTQYGNRILQSHKFDTDARLIDPVVKRFLENLSTIQDHVRDTVIVPREIDHGNISDASQVAELLRAGEVRGTWQSIELRLRPGVSRGDLSESFANQSTLVQEGEWSLRLGDHEYNIGVAHEILAKAALAADQPDDGSLIRLVPGTDDSFIRRLGPIESSNRDDG